MVCSITNLILVFPPSELLSHSLHSYLYSVCDLAGIKLEKIGETDSPPLTKYLTSPQPFRCAFPQMEKQRTSLEPR